MATTKFESKRQVLQYLKNLPDEDAVYYGNFILGLANRPYTNKEIAIIRDEHRAELEKKEKEIQRLHEKIEGLAQLIEKKEGYEETLMGITKHEAMQSKDDMLQEKNKRLEGLEMQLKEGIQKQQYLVEHQTKEIRQQTTKIADLEVTINKFAGTRQKSVTRGQQGEEFLETILKESGSFEVVEKIMEKNKGDFLVRFPRSFVEIMFENKDVSQKVKKSQKDRFQADLDSNSYNCGILVSLSEIVDNKIDDFSIHKSSKGKPFLYINNLRDYEKPEIILKVACLALVYSVEGGCDAEEKPARSFISEQLHIFTDLQTSSKAISKQADQLMKQAAKNQTTVDKIYKGFEKLRIEIEKPAPSGPQTGSKRPRNEEDDI